MTSHDKKPLLFPNKTQLPTIAFEGYLYGNDRLIAFDCPQKIGKNVEERIKLLQVNIPEDHPLVKVASPLLVSSKNQGNEAMMSEGIIFRKQGSKYLQPDSLYKFSVSPHEKGNECSSLLFV